MARTLSQPPHSWREAVELLMRTVVAVAPLVLLILPADFFDQGPPLCPSQLLLPMNCPGCGLTRGTQHLLHLDWKQAMEYNPLVVVTTPMLAWLWLKLLRSTLSSWAAMTKRLLWSACFDSCSK
ncbi:MAG: DUF2752 domain-containing protein [Bacteroidia bacterium]|nr:DUF2752 domain-containing protein [Bacteroidia bacterium]